MSLNRSTTTPDPLLQVLSRCEGRLAAWISGSENNASLFQRDPVAALRAANLDLDEDTLRELEEVTASIARKLKTVM